jgi:hypothetical protein
LARAALDDSPLPGDLLQHTHHCHFHSAFHSHVSMVLKTPSARGPKMLSSGVTCIYPKHRD